MREVEVVFKELGFHGVFSFEGEDWRRQRRLAVTALNSNRLHSHFPIIGTAAERLRRRLQAAARSGQSIKVAVGQFIEEARRRIEERPELREAPTNFLEAMLAAQATGGSFSDEEILGNTLSLLFAGEDTTAHSLAWTLWYLAREPEVQERWAQEAAEVLGDAPVPVDHEMAARFPYGEAVLRESMRLKAVAPASMYEPLADTGIAGVRIPVGTRIAILARRINREAGGPEFDPERWLDRNRAPDQRSFLTFGAGPRFCPGRNLAMLEANCALAAIGRDFELELDESGGAVEEFLGFVMVPRGLKVRLREREPGKGLSTVGSSTAS